MSTPPARTATPAPGPSTGPSTGASSGPVSDPESHGAPQGLSAKSFAACLTILLAIFVFLHPLWEPMAMEQMDENILWSYYPIPLLVLAALAIERKLGWAALCLETIKLTLVKFAVTFLFANMMWSYVTEAPGVGPSAPPPTRVPTSERPFHARPAPEPVPVDSALTGELAGRVVDETGTPLRGAVVYVSGGLQAYSWPAPTEATRIELTEATITPALALVQTYQQVLLRTTDGVMHTAQATGENGEMLFNYPVLPGTDRDLMFDRQLGEVTLTCRAHETGGAALLILSHPFAALPDADGRFAFVGVPAGTVELAVRRADGTRSLHTVQLEAGGTTDFELSIP